MSHAVFLWLTTQKIMKNQFLFCLLTFCPFFSFAQSLNSAPYYYSPPIQSNGVYGSMTYLGAISNVSIGTLNNSSTLPLDTLGSPFRCYRYFNNLTPPILYRDSTYILSITFDSIRHSGSDHSYDTTDNSWYDIGIDFDTLPAHLFNSLTSFIASGTVNATYLPVTMTFSITIPHTCMLDTVRMRIVRYGDIYDGTSMITPTLYWNGVSTNWGNIGETQDYKLSIGNIPPPDTTLTSVQNIAIHSFKPYPNPTTGILHICYPSVIIYSPFGQKVYEEEGNSELNISFLPSGIYYTNINGSMSIIQKQ